MTAMQCVLIVRRTACRLENMNLRSHKTTKQSAFSNVIDDVLRFLLKNVFQAVAIIVKLLRTKTRKLLCVKNGVEDGSAVRRST